MDCCTMNMYIPLPCYANWYEVRLASPICRPGGLTKPGDARAEESAAASLCPATHFISPFYRPRYYPQFYGVQPVYMSISFKLFIKTFRQVLKALVVAATLLRLAFLRRALPYPTLSRRSVSTCHSSRAAETFDPLGNKHVASSTIIILPSCIISRFPGRFVDEKAPRWSDFQLFWHFLADARLLQSYPRQSQALGITAITHLPSGQQFL